MTELDYIAHQIPFEEFVALVTVLCLVATFGVEASQGGQS